ncbi:putative adipose-regulatory protein-domain-containing protein [Halteromyces radiatus]|uniref:putative adipose-regulatory protein-domain-containing protein n=1 Tax=Halteromyces radiatus TaxID=101107 RepID=UPI00221FCF51|nr:putative adipose-regulatory protein-domain-containing protein [Halteromyces radiatus]KAI8081530.1 putative adipose-regulatory protein-domain-containing protein [Halteromyces radiatus]
MSQSLPARQGRDNGFQVVPSYDENDAFLDDHSSIDSQASHSPDVQEHSSIHRHNDDDNPANTESSSDDELPPFEWHPAALALGRVAKKLATPILRVIFAPKAQRTMIKSAIFMVVFVWILLTSITAYLTFYQQYVPRTLHSEPIFFQYGHVDQRLSVEPKAIIDLTDGYQNAPLRHEQAYDVFVQLHVPTSDINFDLGNFMVHAELLTQDGTMVSESSRPAILRYQSHTQRILHVLAKAVPLLIGFTEESQIITVPLIEGYVEQKSKPVVQAAVTISSPTLQIYDAQLSVRADFRGLRYYMYHRRIPTAITFIILFMLIELLCATVAWKSFGQNLWLKIHDLFEEAALEQQSHQQQLAERVQQRQQQQQQQQPSSPSDTHPHESSTPISSSDEKATGSLNQT